MTDTNPEAPLKSATGYLLQGGLKNKPGTVLLYADRIVHVGSNAIAAAAAGGAIGALIGNRVAKNKASGRAAEGGKGVTDIPLATVSKVSKGKQGLTKNILVIDADGGQFRFGVKFDQWSDDIARAVEGVGRTVTRDAEGFTAS
jgi:hypothetical protein